jgi:predicted nucleic acid-binding protein
LRAGLQDGSLRWIATPDMRIELARVLAYPQIVPRLAFYGLQADEVLAAFDRHAQRVDAAPKAPVTCADPDDQIFIDLAVRHRCALLSKDRAVLRMRKRLAALGVHASVSCWRTDRPEAGGVRPGGRKLRGCPIGKGATSLPHRRHGLCAPSCLKRPRHDHPIPPHSRSRCRRDAQRRLRRT